MRIDGTLSQNTGTEYIKITVKNFKYKFAFET